MNLVIENLRSLEVCDGAVTIKADRIRVDIPESSQAPSTFSFTTPEEEKARLAGGQKGEGK